MKDWNHVNENFRFIKDNSIIGAGSTLTKDVEENLIAVERSKQKQFKRRRKN